MKNIFIISGIILSSCTSPSYTSQEKFDKTVWANQEPDYVDRNGMLNDLTTNHKLIGLKYCELIDLLWQPQFADSNSLGYDVLVHFNGIDPDYSKDLNFTFSKDSIITSFKITEWKK